MRFRMIAPCLLLALVLPAAGISLGDPDPCPPPDKPPGPLSARLVAKKSAYVLDRQGMTSAKYREAIDSGKISPPEVDLVLELTNNTKKTIRLRMTGAVPVLKLELKGKAGIVSRSITEGVRGRITYATIEPGKKHSLAISSLTGFSKGRERQQLFWSEPGEYTLAASFLTGFYEMDAGGGLPKKKGYTRHTVTAEPIKLTVKLK